MSWLLLPDLQDGVNCKMASVLLYLFINITADRITMICIQETIFTI